MNVSKTADVVGIVLATGTYIFVSYLIFDEYQTTGELNAWMLGSLLTMLLLALGTLYGFGRLESILENLPVGFKK